MSKALPRKPLWRLMMFRVTAGCRRVCSEIPGRSGSSQDPFGLNWEAVRVPYHSFNTQSCQLKWSSTGQGQLLSTFSTRKLKWKPDPCVYVRVCLVGKEMFWGQQLLEDHLPHPYTATKHSNLPSKNNTAISAQSIDAAGGWGLALALRLTRWRCLALMLTALFPLPFPIRQSG